MKTGFFFQGNALLLPDEFSDAANERELNLDLVECFKESPGQEPSIDEFEVPALDGQGSIHAVNIPPNIELPPGWSSVSVRHRLPMLSIGMAEGKDYTGRLLRAFHIAQWRTESRFCGSCGHLNGDSPDELARLCPACKRIEYPRIAPAIIVIITNDKDQVLLAHNKKFTACIYSLIAGFNEAGESLEATVRREVREEVNIEISDIRYIVSQPWPFPHSLMMGFSARHAGGEIRADGIEIEDARWWSRDDMPQLPGHASVSRYLINRWLEGK